MESPVTSPAESSHLEMTILCNNRALENFQTEHGLAILLRTPSGSILFDTGSGTTLLSNAALLNISLQDVVMTVLSHGHYDHTGGVSQVTQQSPDCIFLAHPEVDKERFSCYGTKSHPIGMPLCSQKTLRNCLQERLIWTETPYAITPYLGTSGTIPRITPFEDSGGPFYDDSSATTPDSLMDDLGLWIHTPNGLILILGCCHAGIINTIVHMQKITGVKRIAGIIGGLHLLQASAQRLKQTIFFLRDLKPDFLLLGHCTGDTAIEIMGSALPETKTEILYVGTKRNFTGVAL